MAISLVNNVGAAGTQNGVTTSGIDTTGANLLIASAAWFTATTPDGTFSDSKSNTWTQLTKQTVLNVGNRLFYSLSPTVGTGHTFTYDGSSIYPSIEITAWSGVNAYDSAENGASGSSISTLATGSVTPSTDGSLLIAGLCHENNSSGAVSIDNGFTISDANAYGSGTNEGGASAYLVQGTAAAINPTWDITNAAGGGMCVTIAVFNPTAGGGVSVSAFNLPLLGVG